MLGALLANGYRSAIDGRLEGIPDGAADTAREGIADAVEVAPTTGSHAPDLLHAARQSFVDGWQQAMRIGAAVTAALLLHVALRGPEDTAPPRPDDRAAPRTEAAENVTAR
ncbi:hypothetical protein SUDANB15_05593 [Streptomyces sp. enrichment culture]